MTREEKLTNQVKHLFNTIGAEDILQEHKGVWHVQGKPLNDAQMKLIMSEAKIFTETTLWRVLQLDIKYQANKAMFEKGKSEADLTAGKLWTYTLECIRTRLESLGKGRGIYNTKDVK